jgi:hypothetical protein
VLRWLLAGGIKLNDGILKELTRVLCKDEGKELQDALSANHALLPGDQICPDDPRRWLLIKREMPIPDPNTGDDRWSLDFVFIDQSAILTFVECKRYSDTRSRREVVGQIIEYAANGQYYWTGELLKKYAEESAKERGTTLSQQIKELLSDDFETESESNLFEQAISKLKEGVVRIIFYLEEAPRELKSIVDFLNQQMNRAEVLIVEARQYENNGNVIIVPQLFGYTEQARFVKETVNIVPSGSKSGQTWDKQHFFEYAKSQLDEKHVSAMRLLFDVMQQAGAVIEYGRGVAGSYNPKFRELCPRSVVTVYGSGGLQLNFGYINGSPQAERLRDSLYQTLKKKDLLPLKDDALKRYPSFEAKVWTSKTQEIAEAIIASVEIAKKSLDRDRDAPCEAPLPHH